MKSSVDEIRRRRRLMEGGYPKLIGVAAANHGCRLLLSDQSQVSVDVTAGQIDAHLARRGLPTLVEFFLPPRGCRGSLRVVSSRSALSTRRTCIGSSDRPESLKNEVVSAP